MRFICVLLVILSSSSSYASPLKCTAVFQTEVKKQSKLPWGFWQKQENLNELAGLILTARDSAFLHELKDDPLNDLRELFLSRYGVHIEGKKISTSVRTLRLTSDWAKALAENGHPATIKERTQLRIANVIRKLHSWEFLLSPSELSSNSDPRLLTLLEETFQEPINPDAFIQRTRKVYGSWENTLRAHGLDPQKILKRSQALSQEDIGKVLEYLKDEDVTWTRTYFQRNKNKVISNKIEKLVGRPIQLARVYRLALEYGTWREWINHIFPNPNILKNGKVTISQSQIGEILTAIFSDGRFSLVFSTARQNTSPETRRVIYQATGYNISLRAVALAVTRNAADKEQTWNQLIIDSDIPLETALAQRKPITPVEINDAILALADRSVALNSYSVQNDTSKETSDIIFQTTGKRRTGHSIYNSAILTGKSWVTWLSDAGLDVTEIMRGGSLPYHLVNRATKASLSKIQENRDLLVGDSLERGYQFDSNGNVERVRVDLNTPETELISKQFDDAFSSFIDELTPREQSILNNILDTLANDNATNLAESLQDRGLNLSPGELENLFIKLREYPDFVRLFEE